MRERIVLGGAVGLEIAIMAKVREQNDNARAVSIISYRPIVLSDEAKETPSA